MNTPIRDLKSPANVTPPSPTRRKKINVLSPLLELVLVRIRVFIRKPQAVFWTYGFPLLMLLALGFAFREGSETKLEVELIGAQRDTVAAILQAVPELNVATLSDESTDSDWKRRLQSGKTRLVVRCNETGEPLQLWGSLGRAESQLATAIVERELWKAKPTNETSWEVLKLSDEGDRYIDFLVPGIMALNLLSGGLWGTGFMVVDMRIRGLLKRLIAAPMRRRDFLLSLLIGRFLFSILEQLAILVFAYFVFGVVCRGSMLHLWIVIVIGGSSMIALGLLIATRVKTMEAMSGWINLLMIPMWIAGGVFFSADRFPDSMQLILKLIPFVAMTDSLRAIMLDGQSISALGFPILVMSVWGVCCFAIAIKIFRWR